MLLSTCPCTVHVSDSNGRYFLFKKVVVHFADKEDAQPCPRLFVADWCGTSVLTPWLGINDEETDTPSHNREYLKYGSGCEHRKS
jgi:hypothetical protein